MKRILVLPALAVLLGGCSLRPEFGGEWPPELPSRETWTSAYRSDPGLAATQAEEDYLAWVLAFYLGNDVDMGWLKRTDVVLGRLGDEDRARLKERWDAFGRRLCTEWSKDNSVRRIDSRHVSLWWPYLRDAARGGTLGRVLDTIDADARDLADGRLAPSDVTASRYRDLSVSSTSSR